MNWSEQELLAAKPKQKLTVTQWAEQKRVLTNAAVRGPYQSSMVPMMVPIMDAVNDPQVETIVLCKSAQIGGTDAMLNILGFYIDQDPSSIMLILADADTAIKEMSRQRIQPMFKDSPGLQHLPDRDHWTKDDLSFVNGARLTLGWASSVSRLASRPFKIVCCDEIDKGGYDVTTNEGDAIGLAKERTNTFANRLILLLSTPTLDTGRIVKELNSCDIVYDWHVPCPHCGQYQPLRWSLEYASGLVDGQYRAEDGTYHDIGGVVWDGGREAIREQIEDSRYQCGECGTLWDTVEKNKAVQQGKMIPRTEPTGKERKVGYHVNRIYSLFPGGRLENLVSEWLDAVNSGDLKQIQGFVNSSLAEPWKQVTVETSEASILKARVDLPPQTVPDDAVALTAGIDHQKYGFWYVVRAWAQNFTSWLIDYGFVAAWADVEELLFNTAYPDQSGSKNLPIWRAAIDTGGGQFEEGMSMTEEVYWWVRYNGVGRGCRVWPTKGSSTAMTGKIKAGSPLDRAPSGKPIPGGLQIISLDTGQLKDLYHYRLYQATETGMPQSAYLHAEVGEDYAKQIQAEEKQVDRKGNEVWVQVKQDNHLLDCEVIAHALVDPEWPGGGLQLYRKPQEPSQNNKRKQSTNPFTQGQNPFAR